MLKNFLFPDTIEAGCDEAGRGCLAGPVCAAAVILPTGYTNKELNDSKQLSEKVRLKLRVEIEKNALAYAVAFVDNKTIDAINILKASILAMHMALDKLSVVPQHILVDGNRFYPYKKIPNTCIVKGDGKYLSIAAASVLAKTYRDILMEDLHLEHSSYGWKRNKGYPTKIHRKAIEECGITPYHRRSFRLTDAQTRILFSENI